MNSKIFYLVFFVLILALSRIIPHPPNFTPIIASAIFGPLILNDRLYGIAIPVFAMFISDLIIGFHSYQFIIYLTLISIGILVPLNNKILFLSISSISASLWFFIVTNFFVWLMWDYYTKDLNGLISCYFLALPFFYNTLISTIFFVYLFKFLQKYLQKIQIKTDLIFVKFTNR